jgi:TetR/AcrR family transcriptional repressor of bet genes
MRNAQKEYTVDGFDENKAAYTLLAMIYGLSFFRATKFLLPGENDNREIALEFIDRLFERGAEVDGCLLSSKENEGF